MSQRVRGCRHESEKFNASQSGVFLFHRGPAMHHIWIVADVVVKYGRFVSSFFLRIDMSGGIKGNAKKTIEGLIRLPSPWERRSV